MTKRKKYTLATKMAAIVALNRNEGSLSQTVLETGIPRSTLDRWVKEARRYGGIMGAQALSLEASLDEQLEQVARQMVAVMPGKLDSAGLQELARSLTIVLDSLNQTRADKEKTSHAREKLAEILERYAASGGAAGTPEPADGS